MMKYADFFAEIKSRFMEADVSDIQEHLAYQFNITGEASGIFYVEVKDGKLHVHRKRRDLYEDRGRQAGSGGGRRASEAEGGRQY